LACFAFLQEKPKENPEALMYEQEEASQITTKKAEELNQEIKNTVLTEPG
jgi:hypothetical protein